MLRQREIAAGVIYDPDDEGVRRGDDGGRGRRFENFLVIKTTDFHFRKKTRFKLGTVFSLSPSHSLYYTSFRCLVCVRDAAYRFVFRLHVLSGVATY